MPLVVLRGSGFDVLVTPLISSKGLGKSSRAQGDHIDLISTFRQESLRNAVTRLSYS